MGERGKRPGPLISGIERGLACATVSAMTTALTDLLLCLTCAASALVLARHPDALRRYGALGMALMALAAGLGTARFAGLDALERVHRSASHLAGAVAPASFALVAGVILARGRRWILDVGFGALFVGWAAFVVLWKVGAYRAVLGSLAIAALCIVAAKDRSLAGASLAAGGIGIGLAGIAIGTEGMLGPLAAMDAFHIVLAASHALVAAGLTALRSGD